MTQETDCPWCDTPAPYSSGPSRTRHIDCTVCGKYVLAGYFNLSLARSGLTPMQRASLSHFARARHDAWELWWERPHQDDTPEPNPPRIDPDVVELAQRGELLVTRSQQADNAIRYIGDRVLRDGESLQILTEPAWFAASIGAPNRRSADELMHELVNAGLLTWHARAASARALANLTLAGWERYEAMIHRSHDGGYGFFAWEFGSKETRALFRDVLKPAFAKTGYPLKDMQDLAQPGLIDNIMQDRIRNASFVIVDLTDGNRGAYWEGGFAEALKKPIVYIMEENAFEDPGPHFDTNHYTFVVWGDDKKKFMEILFATLRQHPELSL